jgi:hypothetical protein
MLEPDRKFNHLLWATVTVLMTEPVILLWHLFLQDLFSNLNFDSNKLQSAWSLQNCTKYTR